MQIIKDPNLRPCHHLPIRLFPSVVVSALISEPFYFPPLYLLVMRAILVTGSFISSHHFRSLLWPHSPSRPVSTPLRTIHNQDPYPYTVKLRNVNILSYQDVLNKWPDISWALFGSLEFFSGNWPPSISISLPLAESGSLFPNRMKPFRTYFASHSKYPTMCWYRC